MRLADSPATTCCRNGSKQYVERPATLCIPLLLATFSLGNGAQIYRADFFDVPTDFWLNMYWLLLCGTLIYLLGYGIRALLVLRKDERSRRIANVYLLASIGGSSPASSGSGSRLALSPKFPLMG